MPSPATASRLASLRHLAAWQEAARRQAHELRTPLTVARLEIGRAEEQPRRPGAPAAEVARSLAEVRAEIQRLEQLVQRFAAFAKLPAPDRRPHDLRELVEDFVTTFADAWPGLRLARVCRPSACPACVDRPMIRQVLVNLCDNSARALAGRTGHVTLHGRRPSARPGAVSRWPTTAPASRPRSGTCSSSRT